nr:hypothetical protein [Tanacetum cinerariifolium]
MIRRCHHDFTKLKKEKRNKGCYSLLLYKNTERVHQISKKILKPQKAGEDEIGAQIAARHSIDIPHSTYHHDKGP